jgi:pantoate kinase
VISEGVKARVVPADTTSISIRKITGSGISHEISRESPPLSYVMDELGVTAEIVTECRLPIGAGFGLSAAALLATLTALDRLCGLGLDAKEIAGYAHESEVVHRTGLGDVAACQGGGMVVRKEPGIDASIERTLNLPEPLYAVSFGPIHTPTILGSATAMDRVAKAFPPSFPDSIADLFTLSREFAEKSGLLTPEVTRVLCDCDAHNVPASMTMLGNGVFAYGSPAKAVLARYGEVHGFQVAAEGARIIKER